MRTHSESRAMEVRDQTFFMVHGLEWRRQIGFRQVLQQRSGSAHSAFNLPESVAAVKARRPGTKWRIPRFLRSSPSLGGRNDKVRSHASGTASSKTKGRPRAAVVENTAEDIKFLGKISGNAGLKGLGGVFSFYSPLRILQLPGGNVKGSQNVGSNGVSGLKRRRARVPWLVWPTIPPFPNCE